MPVFKEGYKESPPSRTGGDAYPTHSRRLFEIRRRHCAADARTRSAV